MPRIQGIEPNEAGWWTRLVYWFTKRAMKKVTGRPSLPEPVKIMAHHSTLLKAVGQMEQAQAAADAVPKPLKVLASLKTSTLAGCPF
jgi:hypothetical protein